MDHTIQTHACFCSDLMVRRMRVRWHAASALWFIACACNSILAADSDTFLARLKEEYKKYAQIHQDPETGLLYIAPVEDLKSEKWDTVENVRKGMVHGVLSPHGYGEAGDSGMADTSLFGGQMLYSMLEAYDVGKDPDIEKWARLLFKGMKIIGTTSPVPGFIVRGPHPNDRAAYYKDSSMDQHSTYVIALWRYCNSPLATDEDKAFIRDSLDKVAARLEKNKWRILWEDDSHEAHASGGDLTRFHAEAVTLLLPMVGAAADVTQSPHWKETYERFAAERDGLRWKTLAPDHEGFGMNAHLCWGQQAIFRVHCLYSIEKAPSRRQALLAHAKAYTEKRLAQEFPPQTGEGDLFNRQTLTPEEAQKVGWRQGFFPGPVEAWKSFKPEYQKVTPSALRVKVRDICILFPSCVFTMAVFTRNPDLEAKTAPLVVEMLNSVDLTGMSGWPRWGVIVPGWKAYALQSGMGQR